MRTYSIDPSRTRLAFAVHRRIRSDGEFTRITGTITVDEHERPQSLDVTVAAASLRTGLAARDLHLRTASFLDARRYPTSTYTSQRIEQVESGHYRVWGVLRLHGHTHPVTLDVALDLKAAPDGARQGRVTGSLPRSAFGIPRNPILRALLPPLIGDDVVIAGEVCVTPTRAGVAAMPLPIGQSRE